MLFKKQKAASLCKGAKKIMFCMATVASASPIWPSELHLAIPPITLSLPKETVAPIHPLPSILSTEGRLLHCNTLKRIDAGVYGLWEERYKKAQMRNPEFGMKSIDTLLERFFTLFPVAQ